VILHRKELLTAKPPFEALKDERVRAQFNDELLRLLDAWEYTVISVCLDKKKHKASYQTWRYDPYHYCLAVLLERFVFFLVTAPLGSGVRRLLPQAVRQPTQRTA